MRLACALLMVGLACLAPVMAAPITFNTALPVSKGELILREQLITLKKSDNDTRVEQSSLATTLVYGITANTTLFATTPIVYASLESPLLNTSNSGVGDSQLFVRHTVYKQDKSSTTFRVAPFAGVKLATGKTDAPLALGTGSTDFFFRGSGDLWHNRLDH